MSNLYGASFHGETMLLKPKVSKYQSKRTASPIKHAKNYVYGYLKAIQRIVSSKPQEVIEAWNQAFGKTYSGMSQAIGFKDQILFVKVYNSSLYALLKQASQRELISQIHKIVPYANIQEIQFLLG